MSCWAFEEKPRLTRGLKTGCFNSLLNYKCFKRFCNICVEPNPAGNRLFKNKIDTVQYATAHVRIQFHTKHPITNIRPVPDCNYYNKISWKRQNVQITSSGLVTYNDNSRVQIVFQGYEFLKLISIDIVTQLAAPVQVRVQHISRLSPEYWNSSGLLRFCRNIRPIYHLQFRSTIDFLSRNCWLCLDGFGKMDG